MVVMFQVLRVKMFSDRPMVKPVSNQALVLSIEVLMNLLILSINLYSRLNLSNMQIKLMKLLLKSLVFKDNKILIRK